MLGVHVRPFHEKEKSLVEAIINGANAGVVPKIIGERMIVTEVAAYRDLAAALEQNSLQHPRSAVITTYALCGFAHLASMAIFVGGFCALAPDKTRDVGRVALRALVAATLACLLTACVPELSLQKDRFSWEISCVRETFERLRRNHCR